MIGPIRQQGIDSRSSHSKERNTQEERCVEKPSEDVPNSPNQSEVYRTSESESIISYIGSLKENVSKESLKGTTKTKYKPKNPDENRLRQRLHQQMYNYQAKKLEDILKRIHYTIVTEIPKRTATQNGEKTIIKNICYNGLTSEMIDIDELMMKHLPGKSITQELKRTYSFNITGKTALERIDFV